MRSPVLAVLVFLASAPGVGAGSLAGQKAALAPDGRGLFLQHCAPCHGPTGRGDGPDASIFTAPPRNLRDRALDRYTTDALVRSIRDRAALPLALDPARLAARAGEVEDIVTHLQRLPDINWRVADRGEEIYIRRCEICHGRTGQPPRDLPAGVHQPQDLSAPGFQRSIDDRTLLAAVRHGRAGMPAIPALRRDDDDASALLAYVRLLSPGYRLYGRYCSSCHGEDGRADELVEPGRGPHAIFDRRYFARQDPEVLRTKVWHMLADQRPAMPHFRRQLREAEVRAIVTWLRAQPFRE